jgi:Leucine-rich repeat (LRR) protein
MARDKAYQEAERKIEEARRSVKKLDLGGLKLTELPEALCRRKQLQTLDLSNNHLTALPESLGQLGQLQTLNLSSNQLTALPNSLRQLTQLQSLDLAGNHLTALPETLGRLTQLRVLSVSNNELTTLPESLCRLTELQSLDLSDNQLTVLPESLGQLTKLQLLILHDNELTALPISLVGLAELLTLNIARNPIAHWPPVITRLTKLRELVWWEISLSELPSEIGTLRELATLDFYGGQLSNLPPEIGELTNLKYLDLNRNRLVDLPPSLAKLENLNDFRCELNPVSPELTAASKVSFDAVRRYLRATAGAQVVLNEAKLILIGEGEVGKSCLLGALRGDPWAEGRPTTHGIEIKPVKVTDPGTSTEITLNGWDFGGQRVYRPTHQLFFSSPAVFLVVWKPREGPQQGFVKEWIKLVKHREPDAKILVVATHGGPGARQPDIDRQELWDLFGRDTLIEFFHVDSRADEKTGQCDGIAQLKAKIAEVAASLPEMGRSVPKSWQDARTDLKALKEAYITTDQALEICARHKMGEEDARLFLTIEHRLGHLIHYAQDTTLRDIVVLKPDWLATAMSFVLDDKATRDAHGLVGFRRLAELWIDPARPAEFRYAAKLHPVFVRLMERYDLSYRVASLHDSATFDSTHLIAQLVPDVKPEQIDGWAPEVPEGEEEQVQICRIVETPSGQSANAEGLFYQLIVRLHKFSLGRADFNESSHWQRGLVLDDDYNGRALLEHTGNDVRITVRAAYPEAFLSVLTHEVKWLVESFWKGMRCDVMVPCLNSQPCVGLFEVRKLIENKRRKRPEQPCPICNEWQDIECLLHNAPAARPVATTELQAGYQEFRQELSGVRALLIEQHGAAMHQFHGLNIVTLRLLSKVDDAFTKLMTALVDEAKEGPRLFSLEPAEPGFFDRPKWISQKFRLRLWCEHSRLPVWALSEGDEKGVYELDVPREWFVQAAPFLKVLGTTLSLALPVASAATKLILDDATFDRIEDQLDLGQKSVESLLEGGEKLGEWLSEDDKAEGQAGGVIRAEGGALRQLHAWLKEKDSTFGGLVRVQNKRQEFVWVHPLFESEY